MERSVLPERKCKTCRPFLVLLLLLFLQFSLFAIAAIISYAAESGVAHLHHVLFDLTPPLPLETSLMLYCVSLIAECITEVQHKNWTILSVKNHHIMLIVIPNIIYTLVFSLAFINIFIEFQAFHSIDHWHFGVPERSGQTALYMISISYMIFCLTRLIRKDLFQLFITLPHHQHSHSVVLLIGFLYQCLTTAIYSLPIIGAGYAANRFEWHVATEFIVINVLGLGMGIFGSCVESKMPWPKKRRSKPYFWYENIIYSRVVFLEVVLLPSFHYLFFEPGKLDFLHGKDRHVVYFTFCAALSLLHVVKILHTAVTKHGSADLIFGWEWGRPDLRSRNHMSQSGIDGGFLRDGDDNDIDEDEEDGDKDSPSNGNESITGTTNSNCRVVVSNTNTQAGNAANIPRPRFGASNNIEGGLPIFTLGKDLVRGPISAIVFYALKWIQKIDCVTNYTECPDDENITENNSTSDNIRISESSIRADSMQVSLLDVYSQREVEKSENIDLNRAIAVPGNVNKKVDNFNNNFRNHNLRLITPGRSK